MARAVPMVRVEVEEAVALRHAAPTAPTAHDDVQARDTEVEAAPARRGARQRHAAGRRHPGRWLAAAAVVALGLVGAQATLDAHERAVDARLARVAGAVERVDAPPTTAWRADGPATLVLGQQLVADGLAVGILTNPDGSRDVAAVGMADGRRRWLVRMDRPDEVRATTQAPRATASCALLPVPVLPAGAAAAGAQVACVTTDQVATYSDGMLYVTGPAQHGHLLVLDVATGRRVVDRPTAPTPAFALLPGLVVLAEAGSDAATHVVAEDLVTGVVRWRYTSSPTSVLAKGEPFLRLFVVGDDAVLVDGSDTATVLTATGAARRPTSRPLLGWSVDATGGLWLVTGAADGSGEASARTVLLRAGRPDVALAGRGLAPSVDDASLPGVLVTSGRSGTRASDASSGAVLWRSPVVAQPSGSLVLDGRVVVVTASGVAALDGRDGSTAWFAPADDGAVVTALASDGRRVLAVERGDDDASLVALRSSDGHVEWRGPLPRGDLHVLGRGLVVSGQGHAVRVAR